MKNENSERLGFNMRDAADYLGTSQDFLRRKVWKGEVVSHRLGNRLYFKKETLDKLFEKGKQ